MTTEDLPESYAPADAIPLQRVRRTLIIKLRQLGDVLLTTPVFSVLKRRFPAMRLDALVYQEARPLLAHNPAVAEVYTVDRQWKGLSPLARVRQELALTGALRRNRYDLVINLTEGDRGAFAALLSGAPWRVGRQEERNAGFAGKHRVFTHLYRVQEHQRHVVEQHLDALRRIGLRIPLASEPLHLPVPAATQRSAEAKLWAAGWQGAPFVLLSPTSRRVYKCLPPRTVVAVIEALHDQGHPILMTCGPDAFGIGMVRDILGHTRAPVLDLGGTLDLPELGAVLGHAAAFVGSDSLPMHMAAARQVPTVAWFGPLPEAVWHPWLVPSRVVTMDIGCRPCSYEGCGDGRVAECLVGLGAGDIVAALHELLARRPPQPLPAADLDVIHPLRALPLSS